MPAQFLRLTGTTADGETFPVLVNVADISNIKPTRKREANTIVSLRSSPDFAAWVREDFAEVEAALLHVGADCAPHGRTGRR